MNKSIFEIKGFDKLQQKIKKLPEKAKRKEVLKILRKSAKSTVKVARKEAPVSDKHHWIVAKKKNKKDKKEKTSYRKVQPGNLRKSIGVKVARKAKNPMIVVRPKSTGKYDGYYGRAFVIFGHNIYRAGFRRNRKGNRKYNAKGRRGSVAANRFMKRAYSLTEGKVSKEAQLGTEKYIQKLIDRL